ncbi:MAG: TRAP transporter substrate-binding protein DctP [Chloroflexota bacterium]
MEKSVDNAAHKRAWLSRRGFLKAAAAALAATSVGGLTAACSSPAAPAATTAPAAAKTKLTIKFGHVLAATEPIQKAWEDAGARIKERTKGDVEVQVFPAGQLGGDRDMAEQSRLGANILNLIAYGYMAEYVKDFNAFSLPFLFSDWAKEGKNIFMSPLVDELAEKYLKQGGMVLLAPGYYFGERHIASTKAIAKPDDMKGVKIRIPPIDMWRDLFVTALGAAGTPLEWAEVYSALQTGTIDAAEAPFSSIKGSKLHEVAKNVAVTGHFTQVNAVHVGYKYWDSLPKDVQTIVKEEILKAQDIYVQAQLDSAVKDREALIKEGAKVVDVDRAAFRQKTQVVWDKYAPTFSAGLLDKIAKLRGS